MEKKIITSVENVSNGDSDRIQIKFDDGSKSFLFSVGNTTVNMLWETCDDSTPGIVITNQKEYTQYIIELLQDFGEPITHDWKKGLGESVKWEICLIRMFAFRKFNIEVDDTEYKPIDNDQILGIMAQLYKAENCHTRSRNDSSFPNRLFHQIEFSTKFDTEDTEMLEAAERRMLQYLKTKYE